jgi:hypothetical protein
LRLDQKNGNTLWADQFAPDPKLPFDRGKPLFHYSHGSILRCENPNSSNFCASMCCGENNDLFSDPMIRSHPNSDILNESNDIETADGEPRKYNHPTPFFCPEDFTRQTLRIVKHEHYQHLLSLIVRLIEALDYLNEPDVNYDGSLRVYGELYIVVSGDNSKLHGNFIRDDNIFVVDISMQDHVKLHQWNVRLTLHLVRRQLHYGSELSKVLVWKAGTDDQPMDCDIIISGERGVTSFIQYLRICTVYPSYRLRSSCVRRTFTTPGTSTAAAVRQRSCTGSTLYTLYLLVQVVQPLYRNFWIPEFDSH